MWITVRFEKTLYRVIYIRANQLTVELTIDTEFLNGHILAILCTPQRNSFRNGEVPIITKLGTCQDEGENQITLKHWTMYSTQKEKEEGKDLEEVKQRRTAEIDLCRI